MAETLIAKRGMAEQAMKVEPGSLVGPVVPPPSKSDAHRALICSALADPNTQPSGLHGPLSEDIRATRTCLAALLSGEPELDCRESGTTLRLLLPLAAALGRPVTFTGSGRLPYRPLQEYQSIFAGHGVRLDFPERTSLPVQIRGTLTAGRFEVPGHISSQYVSGLLLALPLLDGDSEIVMTSPLQSAPYVEMTRHTMQKFGVRSQQTAAGYTIPGGQCYQAVAYEVEADYSQAAYWLTANYTGSRIDIKGLSLNSVQGDRAIIDLLAGFSAGGDSFTIDVSQVPDLVPILSVAAAATPAVTRLTNAARLRLKESDRLASTENALTAIGVDIRQVGDGLLIRGGLPLSGGQAGSHGDHRIAMALAIAALSTREGVTITGARSVEKSYPDFFEQLRRLGGKCHEFNLG